MCERERVCVTLGGGATMRGRRQTGNVYDDEVYVRELTSTLHKIRIAEKRAE